MGQQQLLLVILVTIIVGIATVVAINIFGTAADQANRDAVRQDLMAASVQAQAIWARPTLMDGANRDFNNLEIAEILERLNIPTNDESYVPGTSETLSNENGDYEVELGGGEADDSEGLTITGTPSSGGDPIIAEVFRNDNGQWEVIIDGEQDTDDGGSD